MDQDGAAASATVAVLGRGLPVGADLPVHLQGLADVQDHRPAAPPARRPAPTAAQLRGLEHVPVGGASLALVGAATSATSVPSPW